MLYRKRLKWILVIAALLVLTALVYPVTAAEPENIFPGWSDTVTLAPGETLAFTFTPEQTGEYILAQKSDKLSLGLETEGEYAASAWVSGGYRGYAYTLYAGVDYIFTVTLPIWQKENCTAQLHFTEGQSLQSVTLDRQTITGSAGDSFRLNLQIRPRYDGWSVSWTTSDPAVVALEDRDSSGCTLKLLSPGDAVVTATVEDLSVSCTVSVEPAAAWGDEPAKTVTLMPGDRRVFTFTPAESGEYVLYQGTKIPELSIFRADGVALEKLPWSAGDTHGYRCTLESGVEYTVSVEMWVGYTESQWASGFAATILLEQADPIGSVVLDRSQLTGYESHTQSILAVTDPVYGVAEGIRWSTSDPNVAGITYSSANYCEIYLNRPGTAVITATASNGLSAACYVTVEPTPVLNTDSTAQLAVPADGGVHCHFTPKTSGYYQFRIQADAPVLAQLFTEQGDHTTYVTEGGSAVISAYLQADVTCWLELSAEHSAAASVAVVQTEEIAQLVITRLPDRLSFVRDQYDTWDGDPLEGLRLRVTWSDGRTADYTYSSAEPAIEGYPLQSLLTAGEDGSTGTVTLTCGGASASYTVSFTDNPVTSLEVVGQQALPLIEGAYLTQNYGFLYYEYGYALSGLQLRITYADGRQILVPWDAESLENYRIQVSTAQGAVIWSPNGDNTVTFRYLGAEAQLNLTMIPSAVEHIEVNAFTQPEYVFGSVAHGGMKDAETYRFAPDLEALAEKLAVTVYFTDGSSKTITAADSGGYPLALTLSPNAWGVDFALLREPGEVAAAAYYMGAFAPVSIEIQAEPSHELLHKPAKAPTYTAAGHTEHYVCQKCGRIFADAQAEQEILDHASVILPKLSAGNPPTGDESPLIPVIVLLILSALGLVCMILLGKKSREE